jgi:3-methylcrotonyl-CoA carboxylase alpha subunit
MRLSCGDQLFEGLVREGGGELVVSLNGQPFRLSVTPCGEGVYLVRHGARTATLHLVRDGSKVHLFWEGAAYTLSEAQEARRSAARHDKGALEAPMPGRVSAVKVQPGQAVARGEELLVVEAMKMENALRAPRAGVVRAVHVGVGEMVAPGRPLVEIDEVAGSAGR